jgi:hypothetical protein
MTKILAKRSVRRNETVSEKRALAEEKGITAALRAAFPTAVGLPLVVGSNPRLAASTGGGGGITAALRAAFPTAVGLPSVVGSNPRLAATSLLAEGERFELSVPFPVQRFSRPSP